MLKGTNVENLLARGVLQAFLIQGIGAVMLLIMEIYAARISRLEQSGVLHALQVLIENAIGKAKHLLKSIEEPVPVSAYDAFASLERRGNITQQELTQWNATIGLRNRIVHDYMNIDINFVYELITSNRHQFIGEFLRKPLPTTL